MLKVLLTSLAALLIYMSVWFLIGWRRKRLDVADTAWGGGFIVVAIVSLIYRQNSRTWLIGLLVLVWGLRLAVHIWQRSGRKGPDPRYEELSSKWNQQHLWQRAYFSIFLLQGFLIMIVSLPISVSGGEAAHLNIWLAVAGVILWSKGFIFESIADRQLNKFIAVSSNKGGVLDTGLWRYSRHPNFYGELVQWWAIGILALGGHLSWLGLVGPLALSYLLIFVSGIPSVEKRRQKNAAYQGYKKRTSALIPLPPKHLKA